MTINELIPDKHYIAIDKDNRQYDCVKVNDYLPEGVVFCCYPAYTMNGEKNTLVDFKEYPDMEG